MQEAEAQRIHHKDTVHQNDNSTTTFPLSTYNEISGTTSINTLTPDANFNTLHTSLFQNYSNFLVAQSGGGKQTISHHQRTKKRGTGPQTLYVRPSGPAAETFILNWKDNDEEKTEGAPFAAGSLVSTEKNKLESEFPGIIPYVFSKLSAVSEEALGGLHAVTRGLRSSVLTVGLAFIFFLVVDALLVAQARFIIHDTLLIRTGLNEEMLYFVSSLGEEHYRKSRKLWTLLASSPGTPLTLEQTRAEAEAKLLECVYNRSITKFYRWIGYIQDVRDLEFLLELHFLYEEELRTAIERERYSIYLTEKIKRTRGEGHHSSVNQELSDYHSNSITERDKKATLRAMDVDNVQYRINKVNSEELEKARTDEVDYVGTEDIGYGTDEDLGYTGVREERFSLYLNIFKRVMEMRKAMKDSSNVKMKSSSFLLKRFFFFLIMCVILYACFYIH